MAETSKGGKLGSFGCTHSILSGSLSFPSISAGIQIVYMDYTELEWMAHMSPRVILHNTQCGLLNAL